MAANEEQVRAAAMAELARRELERRASENLPKVGDETGPPLALSPGIPSTQGFLGAGEFGTQLLTGLVAEPLSGLAGIGGLVGGLVPGGESPSEKGARFVEGTSKALTFQPRTPQGQVLGQRLGAALAPVEQGITDAVGSRPDTGGAFGLNANLLDPGPRETESDNVLGPTLAKTALLGVPTVLGARSAVQGGRNVAQNAARNTPEPVPTVDELFTQGSRAFKRAEDAGVTVSADSAASLGNRIQKLLEKEGIDRDLHPKASAALRRIVEDTQSGNLSLQSIQTLRKIAGDARGSIDRPDARLAGIIVRELDDYVDNLGSADVVGGNAAVASSSLREARDLWSRARKGEAVERLIDRAQTRGAQFSGSGFENALRTEFRQLVLNDKKFKLFNAEEQAAIRRVAEGGPIDNALRFIGKFAPRGVVSTGLSLGIGAGVGETLLGNNLIGSVALPMLGEAGRIAATRRTIQNAQRAAETARGPNR